MARHTLLFPFFSQYHTPAPHASHSVPPCICFFSGTVSSQFTLPSRLACWFPTTTGHSGSVNIMFDFKSPWRSPPGKRFFYQHVSSVVFPDNFSISLQKVLRLYSRAITHSPLSSQCDLTPSAYSQPFSDVTRCLFWTRPVLRAERLSFFYSQWMIIAITSRSRLAHVQGPPLLLFDPWFTFSPWYFLFNRFGRTSASPGMFF